MNELWPNDLNLTIGSLLHLFQTLGVAWVLELKVLFEHPQHNSFFACLLQGKLHCMCELWTLDHLVDSAKPLAKIYSYKWIISWRIIKVGISLHFSILTMKDVVKEVKLGFLVVDHNHEDIDGCFGYLSKMLRKQHNYILANLMKAFIVL